MRLILIILLGSILSCDPVDDKLVINNDSDMSIYYALSPHADLKKLYQEGLDQVKVTVSYTNYVEEIAPSTKTHEILTGGGDAWERYINKACEDGKLRVYTFNIDTLKKYSWKEVIENNRYLSKMEFSVDDLKKRKWIIDLSGGQGNLDEK